MMAAARAQMHSEASGSRRTSSGSSARGVSAQRRGGGVGGQSSPSLRKQQSGDSGMSRLPPERPPSDAGRRQQQQPKSPSVRRDSYGSPRDAERHERARPTGSPASVGAGTSGGTRSRPGTASRALPRTSDPDPAQSPRESHASTSGFKSSPLYPRDHLRERPPAHWLEEKEQRDAEARQRRAQQVQRDIELIGRIQAQGANAMQQHKQVRGALLDHSQHEGPHWVPARDQVGRGA